MGGRLGDRGDPTGAAALAQPDGPEVVRHRLLDGLLLGVGDDGRHGHHGQGLGEDGGRREVASVELEGLRRRGAAGEVVGEYEGKPHHAGELRAVSA